MTLDQFTTPLKATMSAIAVCGLISLASCGGSHDHDHNSDHDAHGNEAKEVMENASSMAHDAAENVEAAATEVAEEADAMREDMEGLDTLPADMIFSEGTVEYDIKDWMEHGSGTQVFILDKIPLEGEEVSAEGKEQLDKLAALLKANPDTKVEIQAHTPKAKNAVGGAAKKTWSSARALWVKTKLSLRGADGDQMEAKGYGDEQLLPDLDPMDEAQKRIALLLSKEG